MTAGGDGDRQAQLLRGALDMCLLALLAEQPAHGYELVQRVGDAGFPSVGYGTVYPLLTRMRRLDLVAQQIQEGPHGPARKVYTLTEAGRGRLETWAVQWREFVSTVGHILTAHEPGPPLEPARLPREPGRHPREPDHPSREPVRLPGAAGDLPPVSEPPVNEPPVNGPPVSEPRSL